MPEMKEGAGGLAVIVVMVVIFAYGITQLVVGFIGLDEALGRGWAIVAVVVSLLFRFTLPITVGAFLGAMSVFGWGWFPALLFAAPGLLFMFLMIPGSVASLLKRG